MEHHLLNEESKFLTVQLPETGLMILLFLSLPSSECFQENEEIVMSRVLISIFHVMHEEHFFSIIK